MHFKETPFPHSLLSDRSRIEAGSETKLRSLRDALWEAVNGIEEKASGAPVERELVILEYVAEAFDKMMCEPGPASPDANGKTQDLEQDRKRT